FADRAAAERRAGEIAAALKGNDLALRVIGYTDSTGGERRNLVIGQMRANAVAELLVAQGVDRARL
ncbi:MAG: OmpA family protein, partial [Rhodoblastus sp.]|nr:OmpA family protein [Rhodoblastus sp.]